MAKPKAIRRPIAGLLGATDSLPGWVAFTTTHTVHTGPQARLEHRYSGLARESQELVLIIFIVVRSHAMNTINIGLHCYARMYMRIKELFLPFQYTLACAHHLLVQISCNY